MSKEIIQKLEDKYLNVGRVLSDSELLRRSDLMNEEYLQLTGGQTQSKHRDRFGLPMTSFEVALEVVEQELENEGYLRGGLDEDTYRAELLTRLMKWAKNRE